MLITILVYLNLLMSGFMFTIWKRSNFINLVIKLLFLVITLTSLVVLYDNNWFIVLIKDTQC